MIPLNGVIEMLDRKNKIKDLINKIKHIPNIEEDLDELVQGIKSREATEINNKGLKSQITYIVDSGFVNELEETLQD